MDDHRAGRGYRLDGTDPLAGNGETFVVATDADSRSSVSRAGITVQSDDIVALYLLGDHVEMALECHDNSRGCVKR